MFNMWHKKHKKIITIKITSKKFIITPGCNAFYYYALVIIDNVQESLNLFHLNKMLKIDAKNNYELIFEDTHLSMSRIFKLESKLSQNLLRFLTGGKRKEDACMDFINAVYFGCGTIGLHEFNFDGMPLIVHDDQQVKIGQVIGIGNRGENSEINIQHFALNIGAGLYLSTPGQNPLVITTLEQLQLLYKSDCMAIVSPRMPFKKYVSKAVFHC